MVFSSHLFLFYFLPAAMLAYYISPRPIRHLILTISSYIFYGWSNPLFMLLMLASTLIDYIAGLVMTGQCSRAAWKECVPILEHGGRRTTAQKIALASSVTSNLALLGFFKYFNFATSNYDALCAALGLDGLALNTVLRIALPLGISFYTFQSMSYSIDVYRGDARAIRKFVDFACYVSMFPQLVAGPIIRFSEVADQLEHRTETMEKFARGVALFALGLAKKVLIANPCGKIADVAFGAGSLGCMDSWYGVSAYSFQIYFDFSGYSDMAIGLGLMLGFVFPKNFDSPYLSESFTEFWRRWHLSLSSWLRDYLYIPLGGNRKGPLRTYANLLVVMLLGGLWHGASWNFLIWGGMHGAMLAAERYRRRQTFYRWLPRAARLATTFALLLVTWVFFRSADLSEAWGYLGSMFGLVAPQEGSRLLAGILYQPYYVGTFVLAAVVTWTMPQAWDWTRKITWPKIVVIGVLLWLSIAVLMNQGYNPFIYFIF